MEAVEKILLRALDSPLLLHTPSGFPFSKASDGLLAVVSCEDKLGLFETVGPVELSDLHCHIEHLVDNTTLPLNQRIDLFQGFEQCGVLIGDNELEFLPRSPRS